MFKPFRMDLSKSGQWKAKNTSPLCLIGHMIAFWQQQNETSKFIIYSWLLSASDIRKYLVKFRWIRIEILMRNKGFDPIVLNKKKISLSKCSYLLSTLNFTNHTTGYKWKNMRDFLCTFVKYICTSKITKT